MRLAGEREAQSGANSALLTHNYHRRDACLPMALCSRGNPVQHAFVCVCVYVRKMFSVREITLFRLCLL